jgi:hypothetical protein
MPAESDSATELLTPTVTELLEVTAPLDGDTVSQLPPLAVLAEAVKESPVEALVTASALEAGVNTLSANENATALGVTETTGIAGGRTTNVTCTSADDVGLAVAVALVTVIVPV